MFVKHSSGRARAEWIELLEIWIFLPRMTHPREITPHVIADPIVCGEFHRQGKSYTNRRPRGSGDWLLIQTLAGAGRIVTGSRVVRLSEGEAVLYRPDTPQDYATDPEVGHWSLRWVHFTAKPQWQPWLAWR